MLKALTVKGDSSCKACNLYKTAQSVCLMGRGPVPCDVMVVGEAPGHREDDIGKPFQGDAGQLLDEALEIADLPREKIYITNIVHCRPPNNRKPRKGEIKACRDWLKKEILTVKPKFILLLGDSALSAFPELKAKGSVTQIRGKFFTLYHEGEAQATFMVTFHPGAILRDDKKRPRFETDIKKFAYMVIRGGLPKVKGLDFRIMKTREDLLKILNDIKKEKYISLDLETTQLEPWWSDSKITILGLGLKDKQWVIPLNHPESKFQEESNHQIIIEAIGEVLKDKIIIAQNGKYDSLWILIQYGVDIKISHDTMLQAHLLDENSLVGLKPQAALHFGAMDYELTTKEKKGDCELRRLAEYCALDCYYTRRLFFLNIKKLKEDPSLYRLYKYLVMPMMMMYRDAESEGVFVDESKLLKAEEFLTEQVADVKVELDEYKKNINWNSPAQLSKFLFDELKLRKIDGYSTRESILKRLSKKHEVPGLVLKFRENSNLMSKFTTSWKNKITNHRLHPTFKLNGTVTGRPSCEEPNLQQTPRDKRIRSLITAPPGWKLGEIDLSQAELKVAAMLSGDKAMKLAFQTGQDIHIITAELVSGKKMKNILEEERKEWRKKAKAINFGFLYGMGVETFLEYARDKYDVEFTYEEGERIREAFFRLYSGLPPWYEKQHRIARMNGYVRSLSGRIRHLPHINSANKVERSYAERQSVNAVVQGLVSDLLLMAALEIHNSFSHSMVRIVGTIHDSILVLVKEDKLDEILPEIKEIVENPKLLKKLDINMTVPLTAELSVGPWGDGKVWN